MGNRRGQLLEKVKQMKKNQWAVVILVGILLLVIAIPVNPKKEEVVQEPERQAADAGAQDQAAGLEKRLERALSQVEGVGKVEVMITLESSGEKIVEKDSTTTSRSVTEEEEGRSSATTEQEEGEETVYQSGAEGGQPPYVVEEKEPKVAGVMVVAQGGGQAVTAKNITEAVMALFGVEAHKIKVMKME